MAEKELAAKEPYRIRTGKSRRCIRRHLA